MKKTWHSLKNRVTAMLLALICVLGLLPTAALAAGADTIKLERFGMSGVSYQSASLGRCTMHQMYYGVGGKTSVGFCGTKGGGMGTWVCCLILLYRSRRGFSRKYPEKAFFSLKLVDPGEKA